MTTNPNLSSVSKWLDDWLWKFDRSEVYDGPIIPEVKRLMALAIAARDEEARQAYKALGLAAHDLTPAEMITTIAGFWTDEQEKLEELREHIKDRG